MCLDNGCAQVTVVTVVRSQYCVPFRPVLSGFVISNSLNNIYRVALQLLV